MIVAAVLVAVLAQDEVALEYKFKRGQSSECKQSIRMTLEFKGDDDTVDKVKSMAPFMSFKELAAEGDASYEVKKGGKDKGVMVLSWAKARFHGNYDSEDYEYRFSKEKAEEVGKDDKLKQFMYGLFTGGKGFDLTRQGDFFDPGDKNKEPGGEVLDLFLFCFPRFNGKVKVGEEWTSEWTTRTVQKDCGKKIVMKQVGKIEKLEGKLAHIALKYSGAFDVKDAEDANPYRSTQVSGEAKVVFDVEVGRVVSAESKGEITSRYKGTDGANNLEITIILRGEGKFEPR